jgi:hypothetical protein
MDTQVVATHKGQGGMAKRKIAELQLLGKEKPFKKT